MAISLVTGGGGFVGANLIRALLNRGDEVHVLVRPEGNLWRLKDIEDTLNIHKIDITSQVEIEKAVAESRPEYVFHLAHYGGNRGQTESSQIRKVIIDGTANLYQACQKIGTVKAIINAGSSSEYGSRNEAMREDMVPEPNTEYGLAKVWATLYGEHLRRDKNMPISTLRLFSVYGPYEAPIRLFPAVILSLIDGKLPSLSNPKTARDYIHVDDVVDALIAATKKPFGVYNIGTGIQTTLEEAVNMVQKELSDTTSLVWGGDQGRGFDTQFWKADMALTKKVLDWQHTIDLKQGIKNTVQWFKEHHHIYEQAG
jgi:nucleoside-diphosphate-sugar epimerase